MTDFISSAMENGCTLQLYSLIALFGLWLTIFYKKDFTFRKQVGCRLVSSACLGFLWTLSWFTKGVFSALLVPGITFIYVTREFLRKDFAIEEIFKSLVLSTALFLCTILSGDILACLAVVSSLPTFLRWPVSLKDRLQEVRVMFAPVYQIFVLGSCIQLGFTSHLLKLSSCSSLVAGIFLRPDNNEVLKFVEAVGLSVPSPKARKLTHGLLMFVSLVCIMVHVTMSPDIPRVILTGAMFVGGLGILLYAFAAELPRKIVEIVLTRSGQATTESGEATASCTGIKPRIKYA